jgi:hypothetical protein
MVTIGKRQEWEGEKGIHGNFLDFLVTFSVNVKLP